jgi:hypothetical protein
MPDATREFIHRTFATIDLQELRALFPLVAEKQRSRQQFWYTVLQGVKGKYKPIAATALSKDKPR